MKGKKRNDTCLESRVLMSLYKSIPASSLQSFYVHCSFLMFKIPIG